MASESGTLLAEVTEVVMSILVRVPGPDWLHLAIGVFSGSSVFGHVVDASSIDFVDRLA